MAGAKQGMVRKKSYILLTSKRIWHLLEPAELQPTYPVSFRAAEPRFHFAWKFISDV
jgi:hypothetical protein